MRGQSTPASFSSIPLSMIFLYPFLNRKCLPPSPSMKLFSPLLVHESVTMVAPGFFLSAIAAANAIYRLRLIGFPFLSINPDRSTSVSSMIPRSADDFKTASVVALTAPLSSGFG